MTEEHEEQPETEPPGNGRKVYRMRLTTIVAAVVAFAVIGAWLFVFMKIALGGLSDPDVLANSEGLIAILALVGAPAGIIIAKVMDKWLGSDD